MRRGIAPGNSYGSFDIDAINNFNGNLVLRIPLAETPAGPFLNQGLMLAYNSKLYDYQFVRAPEAVGDPPHKRRAVPETFSNAGFGWSVSPGRLIAPRDATPTTERRGWFYLAPDGADHDFFTGIGIHPDPDDPVEAETHDGSFLRLKRYPSTNGLPATHREIEFGDGTVHRFNTDGYLTQIRDRVGHTIEINYSDPMQWVITNRYNGTTFRTTKVNFETRTPPTDDSVQPPQPYTYAPNFQKVISSIEVPSFNGGTATYELVYEDKVLLRDGCGDLILIDPPKFAAPLLTEVRLPEGGKYTFQYETEAVTRCSVGLVKAATLPTLGSIEWVHQPYKQALELCHDEHAWLIESPGVKTRTVKDAQGNKVGEWSYTPSTSPVNDGSFVACGAFDGINMPYGPRPTEAKTIVTKSEMINGTMTVIGSTEHHFAGKGSSSDYGLPFTPSVPHPSKSNRFLSAKRFDASGVLVETTYLAYEGDAMSPPDKRLWNPRIRGDLTEYNGDTGCGSGAACYVDTDRPAEHYDSYGHYRKSITTSNFGPTRTTFTNYTPSTNPWILGAYDSSWVEQGGVARKQLFTFDSNGVVRTRRSLAGSAATADLIATQPRDLLAVFCRDTRGFLTSERFFGGDGSTASIPSGDPCSATPAAGEYQIDHVFTFNANQAPIKHTAKYRGMGFFIADEDIDVNTALLSTSRDVSGVSTVFSYDKLGRLKEVKPTGKAWTLYEYSNASGTTIPTSARVTTRPYNSLATASPLTDMYIYYDSLGRAVQTKEQFPPDTSGPRWSTTSTTYDFLGRKKRVSMPEFRTGPAYESGFTPTDVTSYEYDVFGRPTKVLNPDDTQTLFAYVGTRLKTRTSRIWTGIDGDSQTPGSQDSPVSVTEQYDGHGRLAAVTENSGPTSASNPLGAAVKTEYEYDAAGRLTVVTMNRTATGPVQRRIFDYDGRGFLRWESQPESGMTSYEYDARGNVISKTQGAAETQFDLKYFYDTAERVTRIEGRNPLYGTTFPEEPQFRVLKTFAFGDTNTGTNLQKGKLVTATRYNYFDNNWRLLSVSDAYTYGDTAGRRTERTTTISSGYGGSTPEVLKKVSMSTSYTDLDQPLIVQYPMCVDCGTAPVGPDRSGMVRAYSYGRLTSLTGFASSISYWPNGMRNVLVHGNGIEDTQIVGNMGRPTSIAFGDYDRCVQPVFVVQPGSKSMPSPPADVTLSVTMSGTPPFEYVWTNGNETVGGNTSTITVRPTSTTTYSVTVSNPCGYERSQTAKVTVGESCAPSTGQIGVVLQPDGSWILRPDPVARQPRQYAWKRLPDTVTVVGTAETLAVGALTATTTYSLTITDSCGSATSNVTIKVPLKMPATGLVATATTSTRINVSWPAVAEATSYEVSRRSGAAWESIATTTTPSYVDQSVSPSLTYAYRVYAIRSGGYIPDKSGYSNGDVATTRSFTAPVAGAAVTTGPINEMLAAVNSVRAAAGWPAVGWSNILAATDPIPAPNVAITGRQITSCRARMNEALQALGVPVTEYSDPDVVLTQIKAVHVREVQERTQ